MGVDLISRGVDYGSARQIRSFWSPDISGFSKLSKLQSIQQYVKASKASGLPKNPLFGAQFTFDMSSKSSHWVDVIVGSYPSEVQFRMLGLSRTSSPRVSSPVCRIPSSNLIMVKRGMNLGAYPSESLTKTHLLGSCFCSLFTCLHPLSRDTKGGRVLDLKCDKAHAL